jgi:hypothetical protein
MDEVQKLNSFNTNNTPSSESYKNYLGQEHIYPTYRPPARTHAFHYSTEQILCLEHTRHGIKPAAWLPQTIRPLLIIFISATMGSRSGRSISDIQGAAEKLAIIKPQ